MLKAEGKKSNRSARCYWVIAPLTLVMSGNWQSSICPNDVIACEISRPEEEVFLKLLETKIVQKKFSNLSKNPNKNLTLQIKKACYASN